jgi:MATE family multidrug resistance protein
MKSLLSKILNSKFFKESKVLLLLAAPIVIGQVGQNIIQLADTMIVGTLGSTALGASAFAGSVFIVFLIFGMGILAPTTALFARNEGQQKVSENGILLKHDLGVAFGISFLLIAFLNLLLIPHLDLFNQKPEIIELGLMFFKILTWSILPSMIYHAYKQFTDGIGKTKVGMIVMLIGVLINIAGNYILIHGLYGFPKLGLNGSAWATLFARSLMALLMFLYVHLHPHFSKYLEQKWSWTFDLSLIQQILSLGVPTGLFYLFQVGAFSGAAVMMGWFGAVPLAAHQIAISLASTSFLFTLGIGIAASIRVGFELGRGEFHLARYAGFTAMRVGAIYMSFCALGFYFLRFWFPTFYVSDPAVIDWAAKFFVVIAIFEVFDGVQAIAMGALRGFSDTKGPGIISFFAYWIMGLPVGYWLAFRFNAGPIGIWWGLLTGLVFASILLSWRFHKISLKNIPIPAD